MTLTEAPATHESHEPTRSTTSTPSQSTLYKTSLAAAARLMDATSTAIRKLSPEQRFLLTDVLTTPVATLWPRQRIVEQNFALMLGTDTVDPRVRRLARASVRNYGRMAMDFLTVRTMRDEEILATTRGEGEQQFAKALAHQRGIIFALPHVGSWDVAAVFAQAYGLKLTIVTEDNWVTQLVAGSRREHGVTLAPRDRALSLRLLFRALARGECVVMLSDLANAGVQTANVSFFGKPAPFPLGPARLSHRTGAPILAVSSVRLPDNRYYLKAREPLLANKTLPEEQAVLDLTQRMVHDFEEIIRAYPDQWYPFHPVWPLLQS